MAVLGALGREVCDIAAPLGAVVIQDFSNKPDAHHLQFNTSLPKAPKSKQAILQEI